MSKKRRKSGSNLPARNNRAVSQSGPNQTVPLDQKFLKQEIIKFTSGPIPDPETLLKYEQVEVGIANRIVAMAEKQQDHLLSLEISQGNHRRELELLAVNGDQTRARFGQISATVIAVITIICGTSVALTKSVPVGVSIIGAVFGGGLLIRYIGGRDQKSPVQSNNS